jgi:hypothetical protein
MPLFTLSRCPPFAVLGKIEETMFSDQEKVVASNVTCKIFHVAGFLFFLLRMLTLAPMVARGAFAKNDIQL